MRKIIVIFILSTFWVWVNASFLYQEIDPICSISGTTHTSFPGEVSDTSSWNIPKAYDGECLATEEISSAEKRRIYTIMIRFLENRYYLGDNMNTGFVLNQEWRAFIQDRFFPHIQKFISQEVAKTETNMKQVATLNYAVSIIGYDYFIDSMNLSWEYTWLTLDAGIQRAKDKGTVLRVVEEDWEIYVVTMDYIPGRINAVVEDGIIVSYRVE